MRLYPNHFARAICCDSSRTSWQPGRPRSDQGIVGRMNWVVLRFPCDMKTAARAEMVLEQLNKGLPPEVREPDARENSMQPVPNVTPAKSKDSTAIATVCLQGWFARAGARNPSPIAPRLGLSARPPMPATRARMNPRCTRRDAATASFFCSKIVAQEDH